MAKPVKIMRKVLYARVWSEPATKLAKEYGLSDVGFAKLCKRNDIPRPGRGFWARKAAGHKQGTEPLPRPGEDWEIEVTPFEHEIEDPALRAEIEKELAKTAPEERIVVPESLRGAHSLVAQSLHALESVQKDECGILQPVSGCLDVAVSKDSLRRALRIMDALIKAFEARGYVVKALGQKEEERTVVELMDTRVPFGLRELLVEKKEELDDDVDLQGRYEFRHSRFRARAVPSGDLCLEIGSRRSCHRGGDGKRRRWADGQRGRLEGVLNRFVAGVIKVATVEREARLAHEQRERERREEEKRAAEREAARAAMWAKIEAERKKVAKLRGDAADWAHSRDLRAYIEAVRQDGVARGKDVGDGSELGKWLRWATEQADRLDPLKENPPSILDEEAKYRPPDRQRYW